MKNEGLDKSTTNISKATVDILTKYIPPNTMSEHLEDIVLLLMNALMNNKLFISFDESHEQLVDLKANGWPEAHYKALLDSGWLAGDLSPMKLSGRQLSWSRWYYEMNEAIQELLKRREIASTNKSRLARENKKLDIAGLNKDQQSAVNAVLNNNIILLSGGPGTGKTSTVIQMLKQVLTVNPNTSIGLSAPTGKATRRLQETLQYNSTHIDSVFKKRLSRIYCRTLHSWLQARPGGFGKNERSPLALDLLVIDEMSMVDLALMQGLIKALPRKIQLILVGDPDQLPPIGSGAIWQELQSEVIRREFKSGAIHLNKTYRNRGTIACLANLIKQQGIESLWEELREQKKGSNVELVCSPSNDLPSKVLLYIEKQKTALKNLVQILDKEITIKKNISSTADIKETDTTKTLFSCLNNFMILCSKRNGLWSVNHIHNTVLGSNLNEGVMNWPEGTPIICSTNQPELGLSNGDIGVIIGNKTSRRILFRVLSEKQQLVSRLVHPSRLKEINPAFAMTIHKAQGSESNEVIILWPNKIENSPNQLKKSETEEPLNQKLLYTAITRAKEKLELHIIRN